VANIAGSLQWLGSILDGQLEPDDSNILKLSQESANKLLDLISAILDINRLEGKDIPLVRESFIIGELFELVKSDFALSAEKNHLTLTSEADAHAVVVYADYTLLERVLNNLVSNAIKFTPAGGIVSLSVKELPASSPPKILITVSDTGNGIPEYIHEKLFEKFTVGDQPQSGSGLGLAFCKMALEAHGEAIWVDTNNAGTKFHFTLPLTTKSQVSIVQPTLEIASPHPL
jgi:signal transduction histidine kinase